MSEQLARRLTRLIVIATASRPETYSWSREMGAHHVIDQRQPISEQVKAIAPEGVNYVQEAFSGLRRSRKATVYGC